jgi:DNA-binding GntR family transcriptional regulator
MVKDGADIRAAGHSLSGNLFEQLRKDILQGKLQPGEKLSEQKICNLYGLSRTPVREALHQLEVKDLIETIPNRGAYVVGLSAQDIKDLYEMRKAYEILAVRWAIERITSEELKSIEEAYELMEFYTLKKDSEKMLDINMDFHNLIYKASHNRMLFHTLSTYQYYLKETKTNTAYLDGMLDEVLAEHQRIYQAFIDKDPKAGEIAIEEHLTNAKARSKY